MHPAEDKVLDRFAEALRDEAPPDIDEVTVRRMLRRAAAEGAPTSEASGRNAGWSSTKLAAAAALVFITGSALPIASAGLFGAGIVAWLQGIPTPPKPAALASFVLPTGDRLSVAPNTQFQVLAANEETRSLSLRSGQLLVEARRGVGSEGFRVETPHATVTTLGTVFSVDVGEHGTRVDVFEGRVLFEDGAGQKEIAAGEQAVALEHPDELIVINRQLKREGIAAAQRRLSDDAQPVGRNVVAEVGHPEPASTESATDPGPEPIAEEPTGPHGRSPRWPSMVPSSFSATAFPSIPVIPEAPPAPSVASSLDEARRLLRDGQYETALATVEGRGANLSVEWFMVAGDALRGLHRWEAALEAFEQAIEASSGANAGQAGYLAAWLADRKLHDGERALRLLQESGALDRTGVVGERAWLLRCAVLVRQGENQAAQQACAQYTERFPEGPDLDWAESVVHGTAESTP